MKKLILFVILSVIPGYAQTKADKPAKEETKVNLDLTKDERDQLLIFQLKFQNLQLQEQALTRKVFGAQEDTLNGDNQKFVANTLAAHKLDPNKYVFDEQAGVIKPLNSAPALEDKKK